MILKLDPIRLDRLGRLADGVLENELGGRDVAGLGLVDHREHDLRQPFAGHGMEEQLAHLGDLPGERISGTPFVAGQETALRGESGGGLGDGCVRGGGHGIALEEK